MNNEIIVQVQQGKLQGSLNKTIYGIFYFAFLAVPYAAPPIGDLRFKDPQPPDSWEDIRDCKTQKSNCCLQKVIWPSPKIIGAEDCLYLNIYVPLLINKRKNIAVMVWVHGGHYMNGSGNFHDAQPDYLMERDIILVTINYRLGAFGFLNLNHELASGNQGLKDQVAALQWIKENIAAFGGDPNNITLFGSNAGAKCVHLLMLSPLSKDLFHKAILQSGVATMNWAIENDAGIKSSYRLASVLGANFSDPHNIIASLKKASAIDIINAQAYCFATVYEIEVGGHLFGPSIDRYSKTPFLPCSPRELFHNYNQKPLILGHTSLEFMSFLDAKKMQSLYTAIPLHTKTFLPLDARQEQKEELATIVRKYYFNSIPPGHPLFFPIILRCYNDICFDIPIKRIADERRKLAEAPTFVYEFSYVGNHRIVNRNLYSYEVDLPITTQNDDVGYLFFLSSYKHVGIFPPIPGTDDFKMIHIMTGMWTNFAKTGHPCPAAHPTGFEWKPATRENFYCLLLDRIYLLRIVTDYDRPLYR